MGRNFRQLNKSWIFCSFAGMSGCHIVKRQFWLHLGQFLLNFIRIKIVYTRRIFQLKWSTRIPSFVFFAKTAWLFPPSTNTNLSRCLGFGKFQPSCPFVGSFINVYSGNYERKITIIYRGLAWKRCSREGLFLQSRVHQNPKFSPSAPTMGGGGGGLREILHI